MGRSRITRTYHNKPTSKAKDPNKPSRKVSNISRSVSKTTKQKAIQTIKAKSKTEIAYKQKYVKKNTGNTRLLYKKRDENIRRPVPGEVKNSPFGLIPQAHAQEELPAGTMLTGYTKDHLDQSRATTPDGKDAGIIETVVKTKTGAKAFGKGQKSVSISPSKTPYSDGPNKHVMGGWNTYTPASDTEGRANDKKYGGTESFSGKERTILGKFAQGVSNEAYDIGGVPYGLVTGQDYKTKSILSRATEHAFAGDWDSAGKVISDNPYRFAGNVATNVGLGIIPFGMVARGAGLAGKAGKVVGKLKGKGATEPGRSGPIKGASSHVVDSQGNWVARAHTWPLKSADKVKGVGKKSYAGGRYTNKEINDAERLIQKAEWMPWGKSGKGGIKYPKTDNAGNKVSKKEWIRREKAADADLLRSDIRAGLRDSPGTVIPGRGVIGKDGINVIPFRKGNKVSKKEWIRREKAADADILRSENYGMKGNSIPDFNPMMGQSQGSFIREGLKLGGRRGEKTDWAALLKKPNKRSGVAFIPTTVPKHVGIGYDEYY